MYIPNRPDLPICLPTMPFLIERNILTDRVFDTPLDATLPSRVFAMRMALGRNSRHLFTCSLQHRSGPCHGSCRSSSKGTDGTLQMAKSLSPALCPGAYLQAPALVRLPFELIVNDSMNLSTSIWTCNR